MHKSYNWVEWYILTHHNRDQNLHYSKWSNINWTKIAILPFHRDR
jgi:hypothetical protein